jgi:hypothetical protein
LYKNIDGKKFAIVREEPKKWSGPDLRYLNERQLLKQKSRLIGGSSRKGFGFLYLVY